MSGKNKPYEIDLGWSYDSYLAMCQACGGDFEKPGTCEECLEDEEMNLMMEWIDRLHPEHNEIDNP